MLAQDPKFDFFKVLYSHTFFNWCYSLFGQGFKLMNIELMQSLPASDWHKESRPELSTWMEHHPSEWASERLTAVGNVVFPDMAAFALNAMGHELKSP